MSQYLQWLMLTAVTGSPLGSALLLVVVWLVVDRFTLGVLPDPFRAFLRWRRCVRLEDGLEVNPHDGRARLELAQLLVERKRYARAVAVLRPRLEGGDDDVSCVFVMGEACLGAGFHEQGEKLLAHVRELQPEFRVGEVDLVLGRWRLARGDFKGAKEALERLVALRTGTVEGRVLLARAQEGLGDDAAGALLKDEAWKEYRGAPRFQRKKERWWAWRARPSRPLAYLALAVLVLVLLGRFGAPAVSAWAAQSRLAPGGYVDPSLSSPDAQDQE